MDRQLPIAAHVPPQMRGAFDARWQRVADCIALRTPDRMPVSLIAGFWFARYGGVSCRQLMYDQVLANQLGERAMLEFDPDIGGGPGRSVSWGPLLEALDFRQLEWPGHGAPENASYQYLDREYLRAEEYDDFILDPTGFLFETYLPRIAGAYDGLQPLGAIAGNCYLGLAATALAFQLPGVVSAFERLKAAGTEAARMVALNAAFTLRLARLGYPPFTGGTGNPPGPPSPKPGFVAGRGPPKPGDVYCLRKVGAYNFSQSMQFIYARPAYVMKIGDAIELVRRAETVEDVVRNESVPDALK